MTETIQLGEIVIAMTTKDIKHVHLSVHPPEGHVTLVAPLGTRIEVARAYAATRLGWIRNQQKRLLGQAREGPRQYVTRESHYVWGRRYLLVVKEQDSKPGVVLEPKRISLTVRPGSSKEKRAAVMHAWHKSLMHGVVPGMVKRWEKALDVEVHGYFLQKMKTKWGGCNHRAGHIRLNTELVKKPKDLLDYVIAHEMAHLIAPTHNDRFVAILDEHFPTWRDARAELNELPLSDDLWKV